MSADLKGKLAQLKELHELGLLSDAELAEQKRSALGAFMGSTPASSAASLAGPTTVDSGSVAPPSAAEPLAGATTVDPTAGLPSRLGNYRVLGIIGAGGMGTVVRARHDSDGWARRQGGEVALKIIHPQIAADPAFQERFLDEAELGRRIQHPGLARVYDVVMEGPWLGTVLELIEGKELTEWVRPGGLPLGEVLSLLKPLSEALDHLHREGIVHRDLKPANVKIRPDGRPVLLDLGIAKDLSRQGSGQTKTMTTMGTSDWMAPEQADAKSVTAAADVYAFGLMAYALLSGRMPWAADESELRVMMNKGMGKLVPLSSVTSGLSEAVSAAVMGSLAVEASARPGRCSALVRSLDAKRRAAEDAKRRAAEDARRAAAEQARRQQVAAAARRRAAEKDARREAAEQARREAAEQAAAAQVARVRQESGPHAHTHRYEAAELIPMPVERTREVVVKQGFLGIGREVRQERYTAHEQCLVLKAQERAAERFAVDGSSLVLVKVPSGTYEVGSRPEEDHAHEHHRHKVRLSRPYSMGLHPVTQGLYEAVMGVNPSKFSGKADSARRPVEYVSWFEAVTFCNRLSERCGLASAYRIEGEDVRLRAGAPGFRLPTEHEWEVAARAGLDLEFAGGPGLDAVGWFSDNSGGQTHPVCQKHPNGWGLYDMSGNVWEWCWDWHGSGASTSPLMTDPLGPRTGAGRVRRGGSWNTDASFARVAFRNPVEPSLRLFNLGFRLVRSLPADTGQQASNTDQAADPLASTSESPPATADLIAVYNDPRGLVLHKSTSGDTWVCTQVDPSTGEPQTFELKPQEVSQLREQLRGSPYWLVQD